MTSRDPLYLEAIARLADLAARARRTTAREPEAVTLATVDASGAPAARTVLLRALDERGVVFYTNSQSRKGRHLAANPRCALCYYCDPLAEQALVEGTAAPVADAESDAYWAARPRESQIGAWASLQSSRLDDRATLLARVAEYTERFRGQEVPRPPHWHGYRVSPTRIEFWKSLPARLHERTVYEQGPAGWTRYLLYP